MAGGITGKKQGDINEETKARVNLQISSCNLDHGETLAQGLGGTSLLKM